MLGRPLGYDVHAPLPDKGSLFKEAFIGAVLARICGTFSARTLNNGRLFEEAAANNQSPLTTGLHSWNSAVGMEIAEVTATDEEIGILHEVFAMQQSKAPVHDARWIQ